MIRRPALAFLLALVPACPSPAPRGPERRPAALPELPDRPAAPPAVRLPSGRPDGPPVPLSDRDVRRLRLPGAIRANK